MAWRRRVAAHLCSGVGEVATRRTCRARISRSALDARAGMRGALDIFVDAYGAEAGNLALRTVATRGVYIGGGIAPKILHGARERRRSSTLPPEGADGASLAPIPLKVILNPQAGLLGAATVANPM